MSVGPTRMRSVLRHFGQWGTSSQTPPATCCNFSLLTSFIRDSSCSRLLRSGVLCLILSQSPKVFHPCLSERNMFRFAAMTARRRAAGICVPSAVGIAGALHEAPGIYKYPDSGRFVNRPYGEHREQSRGGCPPGRDSRIKCCTRSSAPAGPCRGGRPAPFSHPRRRRRCGRSPSAPRSC